MYVYGKIIYKYFGISEKQLTFGHSFFAFGGYTI